MVKSRTRCALKATMRECKRDWSPIGKAAREIAMVPRAVWNDVKRCATAVRGSPAWARAHCDDVDDAIKAIARVVVAAVYVGLTWWVVPRAVCLYIAAAFGPFSPATELAIIGVTFLTISAASLYVVVILARFDTHWQRCVEEQL